MLRSTGLHRLEELHHHARHQLRARLMLHRRHRGLRKGTGRPWEINPRRETSNYVYYFLNKQDQSIAAIFRQNQFLKAIIKWTFTLWKPPDSSTYLEILASICYNSGFKVRCLLILTLVTTHSKFTGFRQDPHNRVLGQVPGNGSQKRRQRRSHGSHHCTYPGNR